MADAALQVTNVGLSATEGSVFSGQLATLTDDAGTYSTPSDLSATINWGDGTALAPDVTNATLVEVGTSGVYQVEGTHTYAEYGSYTLTVSASDLGTSTASATGTAAVADAALQVTNVGLSATEGSVFSGQLATLTDDAGTYSRPSDLSATINWGDGTASVPDVTAATLEEIGTSGVYQVEGTHTYAEYGSYTLTVSAADLGHEHGVGHGHGGGRRRGACQRRRRERRRVGRSGL